MTSISGYQLSTGATANGSSEERIVTRPGRYKYAASGTFDGATIQLEAKPAGHASYSNVADADHTVPGGVGVFVAYGDTVRDTVSSAGASTSITTTLNFIGDA